MRQASQILLSLLRLRGRAGRGQPSATALGDQRSINSPAKSVCSIALLICALPGHLALADIDTSDVDAYLMQDMENALKSLEPVLTAGNAESARADAQVLRDGLQYTFDYFVAKGAEDAVKIAADGQAAVERVFAALDKMDLDAAIAAARDTAQNCKACHDTYKR